MNSSGVLPPPAPAPSINVNSPSTFQHTMDTVPATAHIIGKDHPSSGDFQAAIQQNAGYASQGPMPMMAAPSGMQQAVWQPQQMPTMHEPEPPRKWSTFIFDELKMPILVSLLVFIFCLPILNVVIANYVPYLVKSTGDLTTLGLVLKSLLAGSTFWILQRIIVPLLSL